MLEKYAMIHTTSMKTKLSEPSLLLNTIVYVIHHVLIDISMCVCMCFDEAPIH